MLTDKNGKLFGKFNIIDLLFILVIIVAVLATVFKFGFSANKDATVASDMIEYVLKAEKVRMFTIDAFEIGDTVYDDESSKAIGVIKNVEYKPCEQYFYKNDGTIVKNVMPERYDAYVTIECDARISDDGYYANGTKQISKFSTIKITTQKVEVTTKVDSVNVAE